MSSIFCAASIVSAQEKRKHGGAKIKAPGKATYPTLQNPLMGEPKMYIEIAIHTKQRHNPGHQVTSACRFQRQSSRKNAEHRETTSENFTTANKFYLLDRGRRGSQHF